MSIAYTFAIVGFLGFAWIIGFNSALASLKGGPYYQVADYAFAVFPLFILMGVVAGEGILIQLSNELF